MNNTKPFEIDRDLISPNRNIVPITSVVDKDRGLLVGGCALLDLGKHYGTPLYVLDEETIRVGCRSYLRALKKYYPGKSLPLYASKANSSLVISSIVASEGMGLDVVSEGELITALKGGVPGERIFLHGNNKSDEELLLAYQSGATVVIDNHHDVERLKEVIPHDKDPLNLMLRFTPGIECHTHEYIKTGHLDSKFGFDPDQVKEVLYELKQIHWTKLTGIHAHIGSQIFELQPHQDLVEVMIDLFQLARKIGHPVKDLNVGGGLGIRYTGSDDPPTIDSWIEGIANTLKNTCKARNIELPRLMCEPGRSLVATAGITLYKLGSRKEIPGSTVYLSVDGGMSDNPRPITYESLYTACLANQPLAKADEMVTIAGKHCESGDVLLKDLGLPNSQSGDILVVFGTGAYNNSMSSNYNRIPRPAAVLVNSGQAELVQKRELPQDLLRNDVLPVRFLEVG